MFYFHLNRKGPFKDELIVKNEFLKTVFECNEVSSYPDYPQGVGIFNDGMPDATIKNGEYLLLEHIQKNLYGNDWRVLEIVNMDYSQDVPVWRCIDGKLVESTSNGGNIHFCLDKLLHLKYAKSTACTIMLKDKFLEMREAVGMTKDAFKEGRLIGMLIITGKPEFPDPYEGAKWKE